MVVGLGGGRMRFMGEMGDMGSVTTEGRRMRPPPERAMSPTALEGKVVTEAGL